MYVLNYVHLCICTHMYANAHMRKHTLSYALTPRDRAGNPAPETPWQQRTRAPNQETDRDGGWWGRGGGGCTRRAQMEERRLPRDASSTTFILKTYLYRGGVEII